MKFLRFGFAVYCLLVGMSNAVSIVSEPAEGAQQEIGPADDVEITTHFPYAPPGQLTFAAGEIGEVMIGFKNAGMNNNYTVFSVWGHLSTVDEPEKPIRNLTGLKYGFLVFPQQESTLVYRFRTDPQLENVDVIMQLQVAYGNADNKVYISPVYHGKVTLAEPTFNWDAQMLSVYTLLAGLVVGVVFYVYNRFIASNKSMTTRRHNKATSQSQQKAKHHDDSQRHSTAAAKSAASASTQVQGIDMEWIPHHVLSKEQLAKLKGNKKQL